jgi:hypothetical protein
MNIGGLQLDFYDRSDRDLIAQDRVALEKAGLLDMRLCGRDELDKLANTGFGLFGITKRGQIVRRFPIHDAEHAKLAAVYFLRNRHKLPPSVSEKIAMRIHAACATFDVPSPFDGLEVNTAVLHEGPIDLDRASGHWNPKQAAATTEDDYALVVTRADGEKIGFYFCGTKEALQEAADTFETDGWRELDPAMRTEVARSLEERLRGEGFFVPEKVASYAATDLSPDLRDWLVARHSLVPSTSRKALTEMWEKRAEFKGNALGRTLEQFDRMHGLQIYWDGKLADPYRSCYAAAAGESVKVAGTDVSEAQIRQIASNTKKLAQFFDMSSIAEFQRDPVAVFKSLPRPTQEILVGVE